MKKTTTRRIVATVMSLLLLLTPVFSIAVQAQTPVEDAYEYTIPTELISEEAIEQNGHVGRLFAAEGDMNEICLINDDGTNTLYLFDYPVKYVDSEDGVTKDKSNKLKESKRNNYLYVNDENDIKTYFPKKITKKPVVTEIGDYKIEMGIVTDSKYSKKGELLEDNYVFYNQAFGEDTAIGYTVNFNGYKEEIILYSENAPKSYSFNIYCEGLEVSNRDGILTFSDETTGKTVFVSEPFYIYDSSEEQKSYIETEYTLVNTDEYTYILTVELDEEYVESGLTYPVYIDPTITYNNTLYIQDTFMYSYRLADETFGSAQWGIVGFYDAEYGVGRMLISFPEMMHSVSLFNYLTEDEIQSVRLGFYSHAYGNQASTLTVHEFTGADPFDEATANWQTVYADGYTQTPIDSVTVGPYPTADRYYFNITNEAKKWLGNTPVSSGYCLRGLMIKNSNETNAQYAKKIMTSESNWGDMPFIEVTYTSVIENGTYYIRNQATNLFAGIDLYAQASSSVSLYDFDYNPLQMWQITRLEDGYYSIKSDQKNLYLAVSNNSFANNASIVLVSSADATGAGAKWRFALSSTGNYILLSQSGILYNRGLSAASDTATSGSNLIQYDYQNNTNLKDEWYLWDAEKVVGKLQTWCSNETKVAYRDISRPITIYVKNNVAEMTAFNSYINHAVTQWNGALEITLSVTTDDSYENTADIRIYSTTIEQYESEKGEPWFTTEEGSIASGATSMEIEEGIEHYAFFNNELRIIEKCAQRTIHILYDPTQSEAKNRKVFCHELGHALGYDGHSRYNLHVMWYSINANDVLLIMEKNHLKQVYDLMN